MGQDALERLADYDVAIADLEASPRMGRELTRHVDSLIVVQFSASVVDGDQIAEASLWRGGAYDRVTAITGESGDPIPGLLNSLRPLLGDSFAAEGGARDPSLARLDLADLVAAQAWTDVLLRLTEVEGDFAPKQAYYQVLAYSRLGNRTAALEALAAMRAVHGHHWMVAAAEAEIPAVDDTDLGDGDALLLPEEPSSTVPVGESGVQAPAAPSEQSPESAPAVDIIIDAGAEEDVEVDESADESGAAETPEAEGWCRNHRRAGSC